MRVFPAHAAVMQRPGENVGAAGAERHDHGVVIVEGETGEHGETGERFAAAAEGDEQRLFAFGKLREGARRAEGRRGGLHVDVAEKSAHGVGRRERSPSPPSHPVVTKWTMRSGAGSL